MMGWQVVRWGDWRVSCCVLLGPRSSAPLWLSLSWDGGTVRTERGRTARLGRIWLHRAGSSTRRSSGAGQSLQEASDPTRRPAQLDWLGHLSLPAPEDSASNMACSAGLLSLGAPSGPVLDTALIPWKGQAALWGCAERRCLPGQRTWRQQLCFSQGSAGLAAAQATGAPVGYWKDQSIEGVVLLGAEHLCPPD